MPKTVFCTKLQQKLAGFEQAPYPGALGERIAAEISQQAWQEWLNLQTMLINEYRLSLIDPQSRQFLEQEMQKFFFGEGCDKPEGYVEA